VRNAADTTEKEFGRDPIYLACREVAFSLNAMLRQDISDNESVAKVLPERVANFASHLPVVVTAASLQIIEFDSTKYDAEEKPTAKPQEVPCLVYKFPLHRHIQVPVEPEMPMERETLRYLDTFIVNYKSLEDFVRTLASYFDEHHAMMYRLF